MLLERRNCKSNTRGQGARCGKCDRHRGLGPSRKHGILAIQQEDDTHSKNYLLLLALREIRASALWGYE
jgi:hypothetical protein